MDRILFFIGKEVSSVRASAFIIKPEAFGNRMYIWREIERTGLSIREVFRTRITPQVVAELYPDVAREKGALWDATLRHLIWEPSFAGIVEGENAPERLLEICGRATNPHECAPGTIRHEFGVLVPENLADGKVYWRNAIHRPKPEEVPRDLNLISRLLFAGDPGLLS